MTSSSSCSSVQSVAEGTPINNQKTLNAWLSEQTESPVYAVNGKVNVQITGYQTDALLGLPTAATTTLNGVSGSTIHIMGGGTGFVRAANPEGTLVFNNITFTGEETVMNGASGLAHYRLGGKLRFENCTFNCSMFLGADDVEAEFINCKFTSMADNLYAMWISNGVSSFKNCSFTGYRAVKLHEVESKNYDIVSVTLDDCHFFDVSLKPGVSIGTIAINPDETTVVIKNCRFDRCSEGGGEEWMDGLYESDTYSNGVSQSFDLQLENNRVDGLPAPSEPNYKQNAWN